MSGNRRWTGLRTRLLPLAAATAVTATACSNPQAPTDANFRKALDPLVRDRFCRPIQVQTMVATPGDEADASLYPIVVPAVANDFTAPMGDREGRALLDQAVAQGLVSRTGSTRPARIRNSTAALKPTALITYMPTAKGSPYFRTKSLRMASGPVPLPALCIANGRIDQIVRWTDPADLLGRTITEVTYRFSAADLPAWVPAADRKAAATSLEEKATLVRASDGWQVMAQ